MDMMKCETVEILSEVFRAVSMIDVGVVVLVFNPHTIEQLYVWFWLLVLMVDSEYECG